MLHQRIENMWWNTGRAPNLLLRAASSVYALLSRFDQRQRLKRAVRPPVPMISVGNITVGGSANRQLSVQWSEHVEGDYLAFMRVEVTNQRGVLANLAATIADMSSNIEYVNLTEKDGHISTIEFVVAVKDRIHLARIMKKLRSKTVVNRIWRK